MGSLRDEGEEMHEEEEREGDFTVFRGGVEFRGGVKTDHLPGLPPLTGSS